MDLTTYKPRTFRFHDVWDVNGLRLKFYSITTSSQQIPSDVALDAAKQYANVNMPILREEEGPDHGLGYAMLHFGEMSNWLLIHWWAHQDIALRLLASSEDPHEPHFISRDHRRFHACVWEHVIINHERDAWVRHAMGAPTNT